MKSLGILAVTVFTGSVVVATFAWTDVGSAFMRTFGLRLVERLIEHSYAIPHTPPQAIHETLQISQPLQAAPILLFDTRTKEEFATSHIAGARWLSPDITAEEFSRRFADSLAGKRLVFYCSVGKRSSDVVSRVQGVVRSAGAVACENMSGGVFRWYNEGFAVVNERGATTAMHPFDALWGRLVQKR